MVSGIRSPVSSTRMERWRDREMEFGINESISQRQVTGSVNSVQSFSCVEKRKMDNFKKFVSWILSRLLFGVPGRGFSVPRSVILVNSMLQLNPEAIQCLQQMRGILLLRLLISSLVVAFLDGIRMALGDGRMRRQKFARECGLWIADCGGQMNSVTENDELAAVPLNGVATL